MTTNQPNWKFLENLGDTNPIEHGGAFLFIDETGVYPPELETVTQLENGKFQTRRFSLEKCSFENGIVSDNRFHPETRAWFDDNPNRPQDSGLSNVAQYIGEDRETLVSALVSDCPISRARAYLSIGEYFGFDNLDSYPEEYARFEIVARLKRLTGKRWK